MAGLAACKPEIKETGAELKFFDIKGYFKADSTRLRIKAPMVTKTVNHNGKIETEQVKIQNWGTELEPFIASDINKPSWRDSYKIQTGINLLVYTAIDPDVKTRNIMIKKVGGKLIWITIYNHTKNLLYEDKETLTYFPDSLYTIKKWQHVRLMGNDSYDIKAVFN
ncbi:hypothetical protein [Mucilaginibacter myungsuensis]|uniref:Uncharacterized protein n=1 Tax=Mucilaginibacter myungsuensis TaxID=649104 RepID=A0A929KY07_9SPHI|nr:hypothetical protein [Mucilaginibacter myungsuensis]MBE9663252.1 hypothetical protein [Mucilaginibacter myungsuensis]MDN3598885.1 hypothetical protein [Mucilaginibacter myungsuensis]